MDFGSERISVITAANSRKRKYGDYDDDVVGYEWCDAVDDDVTSTGHEQGCQMVYFQKSQIWFIFLGLGMKKLGICYGHFGTFKSIRCIYLHFVYFVVVWSIFSHFGMLQKEKSGNPGHKVNAFFSSNSGELVIFKSNDF
jgi:hypothetical protein